MWHGSTSDGEAGHRRDVDSNFVAPPKGNGFQHSPRGMSFISLEQAVRSTVKPLPELTWGVLRGCFQTERRLALTSGTGVTLTNFEEEYHRLLQTMGYEVLAT